MLMLHHIISTLQIPGEREFLTGLRPNLESLSVKVRVIVIFVLVCSFISLLLILIAYFLLAQKLFCPLFNDPDFCVIDKDRSIRTSSLESLLSISSILYTSLFCSFLPGATDRSNIDGIDMGMDRGLQEPYLKIPSHTLSHSLSHNSPTSGTPATSLIIHKIVFRYELIHVFLTTFFYMFYSHLQFTSP